MSINAGMVFIREGNRQIRFDLSRSLIVGNEAIFRSLHAGDSSDLPEASTQVASQNFQPVKICLPRVWRTVKLPQAWMRPGDVTPREKLLKGEKLPNADQHSVDEQIKRAILCIGKLDLFVHKGLPNVLQGCERAVDAIVTAFPGGKHATVLEPHYDLPCDRPLAIFRTDRDTDEWQVQCHIADPAAHLPPRPRQQVHQVKLERDRSASHDGTIAEIWHGDTALYTRHENLRPGLRTTTFRRCVTIAFHIAATTVTIDRVLYGGRDLKPLFDDVNDD
jgi:plasmid stabilization system protein ParE